MKLLALLAALLIEQTWPLRRDNHLHEAFRRFARHLRRRLDDGQYRQGVAAWVLAVAPPSIAALACVWLLSHLHALFTWLFAAGVLYVTVGFRGFSNFFNEIHHLLQADDVAGAREQLRRWRKADDGDLDAAGVARAAIEQGLIDSHRSVFGPLAWFFAAGPAGALLYRLAALLQEQWSPQLAAEPGAETPRTRFTQFAAQAFTLLDWLPARLTAASFAVAGDFQGAADCWRKQARTWPDQNEGIVLASGAGALGVRLGGDLHDQGESRYRPDLGTGDEPDADFLASAVGLVWRTLVMWVLLAAVVILARLLG
jgi:adenosylcobinamide-phosphate synthase